MKKLGKVAAIGAIAAGILAGIALLTHAEPAQAHTDTKQRSGYIYCTDATYLGLAGKDMCAKTQKAANYFHCLEATPVTGSWACNFGNWPTVGTDYDLIAR